MTTVTIKRGGIASKVVECKTDAMVTAIFDTLSALGYTTDGDDTLDVIEYVSCDDEPHTVTVTVTH